MLNEHEQFVLYLLNSIKTFLPRIDGNCIILKKLKRKTTRKTYR